MRRGIDMQGNAVALLKAVIIMVSVITCALVARELLTMLLGGVEWVVNVILAVAGVALVYNALRPRYRYFSICFKHDIGTGNAIFRSRYYTNRGAAVVARAVLRSMGQDAREDDPVTILSAWEETRGDLESEGKDVKMIVNNDKND